MRFDNMNEKRTWMNAKFTNDMYQMAKTFVEINFAEMQLTIQM